MRRGLHIAIALSLLLFLSAERTAALPLFQEQLHEITSPRANAQVRGSVDIIGSARMGPEFQFYKVEYASSATPDLWVVIGDIHNQEKTDERLETWHTASLPDGAYYLHLVVVKKDGNYEQTDPLRVNVANAEPAPTHTPEESPTPTPTIVIPTPTTAIVEQPTVVRSTPSPSAEPEASPTIAQETESTVAVPSVDTFARQCAFGAFVAAVLFVFVGVVFLVRRLI
jgi:cell division septation protein DedD